MCDQTAYIRALTDLALKKKQKHGVPLKTTKKILRNGTKFPRSASRFEDERKKSNEGISPKREPKFLGNKSKDSFTDLLSLIQRRVYIEIRKLNTEIIEVNHQIISEAERFCFLGLPYSPFTTFRYPKISTSNIQEISDNVNYELEDLISKIQSFGINNIKESLNRVNLSSQEKNFTIYECWYGLDNVNQAEEIKLLNKAGNNLSKTKNYINKFFWDEVLSMDPVFQKNDGIEIHLLHFLLDELENVNLALERCYTSWSQLFFDPRFHSQQNSKGSLSLTKAEILKIIQTEASDEETKYFLSKYLIPVLRPNIRKENICETLRNIQHYANVVELLNGYIIAFMNFSMPGYYKTPHSRFRMFISNFYKNR